MSLLRNLGLIGVITVVVMGMGLVSFLVMARLLGPMQFGGVALRLSVVPMLALVANAGFTRHLLRPISALSHGSQRNGRQGFDPSLYPITAEIA